MFGNRKQNYNKKDEQCFDYWILINFNKPQERLINKNKKKTSL